MNYVNIDEIKCSGCGRCAAHCDMRIIQNGKDHNKAIFEDPLDMCMKCGHCYSVCPSVAITLNVESDKTPIAEGENPTFESLRNLLLNKRSTRHFKKKDVEKKKIDIVLDAMKAAPSSGNYQHRKYIVISDREKLNYLSCRVIKIYRTLIILNKFSFIFRFLPYKKLREIITDNALALYCKEVIEDSKKGIDRTLHDAPSIIIEYSRTVSNMTGNDAGIALTYGMLTAEVLGLGTTWIGLLQEAFSMDKKLKKYLNIPANENVWGVFTLGYPSKVFLRPPPRDDLNVKWM